MSVLLLGPPRGAGDAVIERLTSQGDEVGVIEADLEQADRWKALGARVAHGSPGDADLIERAAQNSRTVVLFDIDDRMTDLLDAVITGASQTSVDRVIVVAAGSTISCVKMLRSSGLDYIVLHTPRHRTLFRRNAFAADAVAEAVDAGDDLAGHPRLELEVSHPAAARALGLNRI
ncbi:MAG: hypothetical protein QOH48_2221 [Actinomycetota bacterium]|jgi:hypothetical protein|nr:hypothetical protein [Actinomycetota bacterium]